MTTARQFRNIAAHRNGSSYVIAVALAIVFGLAVTPAMQAQTFTVLHSFTDTQGDGGYPNAGVTLRGGVLYGTTEEGGFSCANGHRCGTVYQVTRAGSNWVTTPIFRFPSTGEGGLNPISKVVFGPDGHLYGMTPYGGTSNDGVIFILVPPLSICRTLACFWTETVVHNFAGAPYDGANPGYGKLVWDQYGNAYGTTRSGGAYTFYGTVFELVKAGNNWMESLAYNFGDNLIGGPQSGLAEDRNGNFFGTSFGGAYSQGTVFELSYVPGVGWKTTDLYDFTGNGQPSDPYAGLVIDSSGNLYGTTLGGNAGNGSVFELSPSGSGYTFKVLHNFGCGWCGPQAGLTMDAAGNLYGTSYGAGAYLAGSVFKLTNSGNGWVYSTIHDFTGGNDGANPVSTVTIDTDGTLYGTASVGGNAGGGTVWMIKP